MSTKAIIGAARVVITAEQLQKRVAEMGRQIAHDYQGKTLHLVCVLENGFVFMADLIRALELPVVCHFVRPASREILQGTCPATEIFFSPEPKVQGADVLLLEALLQSGLTTDFLMRTLFGRGAATVKLVALLDRQGARRVLLQPDYCGFLLEEAFVFGYGLGTPQPGGTLNLGRNVPYIATLESAPNAGQLSAPEASS